MLRVLLAPSVEQRGRRQFEYSLPALFHNAAGQGSGGATAVGSRVTIGRQQHNTVWVKPQHVSSRHAQLRLKLTGEAAAGGSGTGSPASPTSPGSPAPGAVKLQVRCLAVSSRAGSSSSLSWESARGREWRELPLMKWCTLHEGDAILLGAGPETLADAWQEGDRLQGCCVLQVVGLRELRKWAWQQAWRQQRHPQQQASPGLPAQHGTFPALRAAVPEKQQQQQQQQQQQEQLLREQQRPLPPRRPELQVASKKRRRDDGARPQGQPSQLPLPAQQQQQQRQPGPSSQAQGQLRQPRPGERAGRDSPADSLTAPQRSLGVAQVLLGRLLQSVQKTAAAERENVERAAQLVQQAAQVLSQELQGQEAAEGDGSSPSDAAAAAAADSASSSPVEEATRLPLSTQPQPPQRRQQLSLQHAEEGSRCTPAGPPVRQHTVGQAHDTASSGPSVDEAAQLQGPVATRATAGDREHQPAPAGCVAAAAAAAAPPPPQPAAAAAAAAGVQRSEQGPLQPVEDVAAELERLGKRYTGAEPMHGIRLRVKQDTLARLRRIAQQAPDLPCCATVKPQWGLRRLLAEGFRPAQLCRRPGPAALVGDGLMLRTTCRLKTDDACGWLSGVLTEAGSRKASSFTSSEYFIPREKLNKLAREFGAEYSGEDLMLEMDQETNEWGFLNDTLFRGEEGTAMVNVKPFVALLYSPADGLALPLPVVYATRPIRPGEELVADGLDELHEQDLLLDALASRLIASGWRCHILDAFWLRLVRLADARSRQLALAGGGAGAARELRRALERAVALYYQHGGSGDNGRAADEGGGHGGSAVPAASVLQLLDAALAASTLEHRPPASAATLSRLEQPPLEQQFRPLAGRELPPLRRACDFGALPADVLAALDSAPEGPPLEEDVRQRLRCGDVPKAAVCEIRFRLHRVRLLAPPDCPAHSLNAAPGLGRLASNECLGVYVGRVVTAEVAEEQGHNSASYLFDIKRRQVGPHLARGQAWSYQGPDLVVDASQLRNELAFANDIFGAAPATRPSLYAQVIWDPQTKRPALKMSYVLSWKAKPLQELLLSYGDTYWPVEGPKLRRKHEEYAARAAQAIALVRGALLAAGAPPADVAACLAPVDLAAEQHRFYEAFSLD